MRAWPDFIAVIALVAQTTADAARDWFFGRFLANFDVVVILTAMRVWSKSEHAKTAEALRLAREELAQTVANTATVAAEASAVQNANILRQVKVNTDLSVKALDEVHAVNSKIADPSTDKKGDQK